MSARENIQKTWVNFGSLINTVLIVAALAGMFYQRGALEERMNNRIDTNSAEITRYAQRSDDLWATHETLHRERLAEVKLQEGKTSERFAAVDQRLATLPEHDFRIRALEAQIQSMNTFMTDTRRDLNSLVTSMKLVEQAIVNMAERQPNLPIPPSRQ